MKKRILPIKIGKKRSGRRSVVTPNVRRENTVIPKSGIKENIYHKGLPPVFQREKIAKVRRIYERKRRIGVCEDFCVMRSRNVETKRSDIVVSK